MTTRSSILAFAALATLAISALAPTEASAWGRHGGYGGGYRSGYGGGYGGGYRQQTWRTYPRPGYANNDPICERPERTYGSAPVAYTPTPTVTYRRPYVARPTYAAEPVEAPAPQVDAPAPQRQAYVPPQQTEEPSRETAGIQSQQVYTPAPQTQAYAPQPQVYAPAPQAQAYASPQQESSEDPSEQQPSQDRAPAKYSSRELQK